MATISALVPMAQTKPSSSRATAVTIFLWSLPARAQLHIALVQPMLRLPCNLFRLLGDAPLSPAQSIPDAGWTTIAPGCFDNDSSQVRVVGFGDASASGSLAAGVFAGHSAAITHQLASTAKAGYLAKLGRCVFQ